MEMRRSNSRNPVETPKPMSPPAGTGRANLMIKPIPANQGSRPMQAAPHENKPEQQPAAMPNTGSMSSRNLGSGRVQSPMSMPGATNMSSPYINRGPMTAPVHTNANRPAANPMAAPNANPMHEPINSPNTGNANSRLSNRGDDERSCQ